MTSAEKHAISHRGKAFCPRGRPLSRVQACRRRPDRDGYAPLSPATQVYRPLVDHLVTVGDVESRVIGDGRVDMSGSTRIMSRRAPGAKK